MIHIIYVGVTLIVGVMVGWKTYPFFKSVFGKDRFTK
jgi:hypothetical protein